MLLKTDQNDSKQIETLFNQLINGTCCLLGDEQQTARTRLKALADALGSGDAKLELGELLQKAERHLNASAGDAFRNVLRSIRTKWQST